MTVRTRVGIINFIRRHTAIAIARIPTASNRFITVMGTIIINTTITNNARATITVALASIIRSRGSNTCAVVVSITTS